ncbi:MAG TPA: acyl-CoA dehydrogenase family protein, partial [Acetobacteraceae bacterium]|nr:acyl-CoA dehydrogenase family protein [Acetobacteraceae bacterium]
MSVLNIDRPDFLRQEDVRLFEDSVRRFLEIHAPDTRLAQWRRDGMVERTIWREAGAAGLLCLSVPEAYGGAGGDYRHEVVLIEQLAHRDANG